MHLPTHQRRTLMHLPTHPTHPIEAGEPYIGGNYTYGPSPRTDPGAGHEAGLGTSLESGHEAGDAA